MITLKLVKKKKVVQSLEKHTKEARLLDLLSREEGASVSEISIELGWLPHTVRAAISSIIRRKLGLEVSKTPHHERGLIYKVGA